MKLCVTLQGPLHDLKPVSVCKHGLETPEGSKADNQSDGSNLFHDLIDNVKTLSSGRIWMSYRLPFYCNVLQSPTALKPNQDPRQACPSTKPSSLEVNNIQHTCMSAAFLLPVLGLLVFGSALQVT